MTLVDFFFFLLHPPLRYNPSPLSEQFIRNLNSRPNTLHPRPPLPLPLLRTTCPCGCTIIHCLEQRQQEQLKRQESFRVNYVINFCEIAKGPKSRQRLIPFSVHVTLLLLLYGVLLDDFWWATTFHIYPASARWRTRTVGDAEQCGVVKSFHLIPELGRVRGFSSVLPVNWKL